ncbi:hypothetical protein HUJ05_010276 [Dendroctonus ponderosae]|nr:hypothetical protein HUJ05_010276 [Dendroctonus ponderosae]
MFGKIETNKFNTKKVTKKEFNKISKCDVNAITFCDEIMADKSNDGLTGSKKCSSIDYISHAEHRATLKYRDNANNPVTGTNPVILACKQNKSVYLGIVIKPLVIYLSEELLYYQMMRMKHVTMHFIMLFVQEVLSSLRRSLILEEAKDNLKDINIGTFHILPNLKREKAVAKIVSTCPQLEELYSDYQQIRDIESLEKISRYVNVALSADPKKREGQRLLMEIVNSESYADIKEVLGIFSNVDLDRQVLADSVKIIGHDKLEKIINELNNSITDKTIYEKALFTEIESIINFANTKLKNIKTDFVKVVGILEVLAEFKWKKMTENDIRCVKLFANGILQDMFTELESHNLKKIADLVLNIFKSCMSRKHGNLDQIYCQSCQIIPKSSERPNNIF